MTEYLNHRISSLAVHLILSEPFYGHFFSGLIKVPGPVDGIAIGVQNGSVVLLTGERWLEEEMPSSLRFGAVKHELLHLLFRHPFRFRDVEFPWIFHLAADLVVNQYLSPEELGPEALTLARFSAFDPAPFRDTNYYYDLLAGVWKQAVLQEEGRDLSSLLHVLQPFQDGRHPAPARHQFWQEEKGAPLFFRPQLLEGQVGAVLEQVVERIGPEMTGQLPPAVQEQLQKGETALPPLDWQRLLRVFAAGNRRTRLKHTIRRPSKRYGTTPGLKIQRRSRLLVAIDTSASVEAATLALFFNEIHGLWLAGHEITVVECDSVIRKRYAYEGQPPQVVTGRGGTLFDPPLELADREIHPDGIIYFTDGKGPAPVRNSNFPILWILSGDDGRSIQKVYFGHFPV